MPRPARLIATLSAAALASVVLTACQKPIPDVTFLAGSTTVLVHPTNYCFDPSTHCHTDAKISKIDARANSTILVDVPRTVADAHWVVGAFNVSTAGKSTPITGSGSLGVLHNRHSVRVLVPNAPGFYYLSVAELEGTAQTGTWTIQVHITE